ncbi:hypothetical protein ACFLYE_00120 [Chloroflexota bacterium]
MGAVARPTAALERAGIPVALIVSSTFERLASFVGRTKGLSGLSTVPYPAPFNLETEATFRKRLSETVINDIVSGLTLRKEIREVKTAPAPKDVVFTGNLGMFNEFFSANRWTDGLPIMPPTRQAAEEFLRYTHYPPDGEIAVLPPANLRATSWNIAANGVMAGCHPEFMPVLIAIIKAISQENFNLRNINTTWGDVPFVVINGPIVQQLGFSYGQGAISLGPNPAIGRFLGLALRNLAGYIPGDTLMGTWGYNLPFVVAESEDQSPWELHHVEKGFSKHSSTVTVGGTFNWGPQMSFNSVKSVEAALTWLTNYTARIIEIRHCWTHADTNHFTLFITPPTAHMFAKAGMTKQDLVNYIWENTTISVKDFHAKYFDGVVDEHKSIRFLMQKGLADEDTIRHYEGVEAQGPDGLFRMIVDPNSIDIVVTGDVGRDKVQWFWTWYNHPAIQEIEL